MQLLQAFLEWGGTRRETARLVLSGLALLASILAGGRMPVDPAWVAIALCGSPSSWRR